MSTAVLVNRLTTDEYLRIERDAEKRHEYLDGELVAMAGGSRAHNLLATRVAHFLGNHIEGSPCRIFQSDMKVRVECANRFYYPDILVCCNPLGAAAPKLIVEVLSPKAAATDDGEKRINYQTLDSLAEYLLLDPKTHEATLYRRNGPFWTRYFLDPEDELELLSIGFHSGLAAFLGHPSSHPCDRIPAIPAGMTAKLNGIGLQVGTDSTQDSCIS